MLARHTWISFLLATVVFLAACSQAPTRVTAPSSKALHTVQSGETVYAIAQKYFVSSRDIILANRLNAPFKLRLGQTLHIPILRVHTIVRGETLSSIAEVYRVSMYAMARLNRLKSPYTIVVGNKLRIPSSQFKLANAVSAKTRIAIKTQPTINKTASVSVRRIQVVQAPMRTNTQKKSVVKTVVQQKTVQPKAQPKIQAQAVQPKKQTKEGSTGQLIWPLRGNVISAFGSKSHGVRNDGINISARIGSAVKAVDHGTVVYAGDKLSGFGRILILRHDKGLMSAYAHNQALLVKRGESVRQGQVIARSGKSGSVETGQLHFEIRQGGKPTNPLRYLEN